MHDTLLRAGMMVFESKIYVRNAVATKPPIGYQPQYNSQIIDTPNWYRPDFPYENLPNAPRICSLPLRTFFVCRLPTIDWL